MKRPSRSNGATILWCVFAYRYRTLTRIPVQESSLHDFTQNPCNVIAERLNNRPRLRLGFRMPNEIYYGFTTPPRGWVAACGKLFDFCPRRRPKAYRSGTRTYFKRRDRVTPVALQT